ncbi:MAG: pyruvate kinase [Oscillospiraceae bacterium]|nr:pyruvate kinase [Oscillospiraceae bacterium]
MRKTKIICTLGPATDNPALLRTLMEGGMNAARFNFSHGNHAEQLERYTMFANVRDELGVPVAAILDTKGPEIRIRSFTEPRVELRAGERFTLCTEDLPGTAEAVSVTYPALPDEVRPGQMILIDDGLVGLRVEETTDTEMRCTVVNGGSLSANKSINIPGAHIRLPAVTERDEQDIRFAVEHDFDFIAASFVRRAADVEEIRGLLRRFGGEDIRIISKIENQEGVDHLEEILQVSDGLMVARGDLGVEIPAAKVPALQKRMIREGLQLGKPVITATQMLDSMIRNPRPTRAEVSDVANAVFDGASCVMLSGETASGKYPAAALRAMAEIVEEAEGAIDFWDRFELNRFTGEANVNDVITQACCTAAKDLNARAIITPTLSGRTARMISRFRPLCPIAALVTREKVRRQLAVSWGVIPILTGEVTSTDRILHLAADMAKAEGLAERGDVVVITAGIPLGRSSETNLMKAHTIE